MNKARRAQNEKEITDFFNRRWSEITDTLEYNHEWERKSRNPATPNATVLDDAILHPDFLNLKPGRVVRSMDDNGRRLIVTGTRLGPLIVWWHTSEVRVWYSDDLLLLPNLVLGCIRSDIELASLIGGVLYDSVDVPLAYNNLGVSLETAYSIMAAREG